MKALVYTEPGKLVYRDEPDPAPEAGEALIQVDSVGICGSDLHAYRGQDERRPPPVILGHEVSALASGVMGTLDWVETRSLREGARAFADLEEGRASAAKMMLRPGR